MKGFQDFDIPKIFTLYNPSINIKTIGINLFFIYFKFEKFSSNFRPFFDFFQDEIEHRKYYLFYYRGISNPYDVFESKFLIIKKKTITVYKIKIRQIIYTL